MMKRSSTSAFWGAAFLMATSAIGPGFLTQTTLFTQQLMASFGFIILASTVIDIGVQLNIWRILLGMGKPAQVIADNLLPGLGVFLSILIVFGGLAFNIGNIAGAALGWSAITGMDAHTGALVSTALVIPLVVSKDLARALDWVVKLLGLLMIGLTAYVAWVAGPPLQEAVYRSIWPAQISWPATLTIVGGTVGGYICFAGAHRLLQASQDQQLQTREVNRAAVRGILLASAMRTLLFLAAFGVMAKGLIPDASNPAAGIFRLAAGDTGFRLFGIVMWSAAITSVLGSAYTSLSFIRTYHPLLAKYEKGLLLSFILVSTSVFLVAVKPVQLLVWAGMINGCILPVSMLVLLAAAYQARRKKGYQHPTWLGLAGFLIALLLAVMAIYTISG
jgi:Mn2+/Fe2+ NRAMP family transporter